MNDKSLRVLIVEAQHLELFFLEKIINKLGYYRIAPMTSITEAMIAIRDAIVPFDLLIINADQVYGTDFDLLSYCKSASQLRHSFIYGDSQAQTAPGFLKPCSSYHVKIARRPDIEILNKFMRLIDPVIAKSNR